MGIFYIRYTASTKVVFYSLLFKHAKHRSPLMFFYSATSTATAIIC